MQSVIPLIVGAVALHLGLAAVAAESSAPMRYTVSVPTSLDRLDVQACFGQGGTLRLSAGSPHASRALRRLSADAGISARVDDRDIVVRQIRPGACIDYRVDLAALPEPGHWRRSLVRSIDAVLISPGLFLWLPADRSEVELRFHLPLGFAVSAPWELLDDPGQGAGYRVRSDNARVDGKIALGRFDGYRLAAGDAAIDVAVLHGEPAVEPGKIRRWLTANIDAVAEVHGRFPVPRLQLLVVPLGAGDEPVPWGQVSRAGGDAVHLYIDQRQSEAAFLDDWVLSHELSHLFHPPLSGDSRWIYEGLASYYQYVSRARTGMLSAHDAWKGLHSGFERGRRGGRPGRTLQDATENMRVQQAYMQVYWSGAAIFLLAGLELRIKSGHRTSLDSVLAAFQDCCLPSGRLWQGDDFLHELDRLAGSDVFSRLAGRYRGSDRFPDLEQAYRQLGLVVGPARRVELLDRPAAAELRDAIMGRR